VNRTPLPDLPHYRGPGSDTRPTRDSVYGLPHAIQDVIILVVISIVLLALLPVFLFGLILTAVRPATIPKA